MQQIIKQSNGKYCLYSSVMGDVVLWDATPDDILNEWVNSYRIEMSQKIKRITESLDDNEKPYYQFTISFEDVIEDLKKNNPSSEFLKDYLKEL